MQENQNIEWKESWRDEYLKWICGFANAQGGKIYIGKNDNGKVVGIDKAKRLMDDLPNKMIIWNQGELPQNWTVAKLKVKHPSLPYNPKISNALFRSGYIEAWGRGTINMINECVQRHLPLPNYNVDYSGFIVEFRRFNEEYLKPLGLNDSYVRIILFVQKKGEITNTDVQEICKVSKRTASNYLTELEKEYLDKIGVTGKGTFYTLKGQQRGKTK